MSLILWFKSPWENNDNNKNNHNIFNKDYKNQVKDFWNQNFNNYFNFNLNIVYLILGLIVSLWIFSGIFILREGEESVITRFGKFVRKSSAGLNYHLPYPIEEAFTEKVNESRRIEIGYRSSPFNSNSNVDIVNENTILTGDENIIVLNVDIMWHIKDLPQFVFNVFNPRDTIKFVGESAIREVIGDTPIADVLSSQKHVIANKIEDLIQETLDSYSVGVKIDQVQLLKAEPPPEVIESYRDVQTARADKEREINQAQAYRNDIIPKARGKSAKIIQEAEGYAQEVISKAEGESKRFFAVFNEYNNNKQVTKDRLYLDAVEDVLKESNKFIMNSNGVLPHMEVKK